MLNSASGGPLILGFEFAAMPTLPARCLLIALSSFALLAIGRPGSANPGEAQAPRAADQKPPLAPEEAARLIAQLDDPRFEARETASKRLAELGAAVVPAVEQGAETDNLEISSRCLEILKQFYEGEDEDARTEATIALKRLSDGSNPAIARRAKAIIAPPEDENVFGNGPGGVQLNMRGFPFGRGNVRVQSQTNNGQTTIDVQEGDREIHITHRNGKNILVRVTDPAVAGDQERKHHEYRARDEADLKKKHPEAARLFEQYGGQGNIQVFGGGLPPGIQFPPGAFPQMNPRNLRRMQPRLQGGRVVPNFPNFLNPRQASAQLEEVRERLDRVAERLKELSAKAEVRPEELKQLADEVAQAQAAVAETKGGDEE